MKKKIIYFFVALISILIIGWFFIPEIRVLILKATGNYDEHSSIMPGEVWGIDISKHQPNIDWETLCEENKPYFIFIKATEGTYVQDKKFKEHWANAKKYNIPRGAYHFFSYFTPGKKQAENFKKMVKLEEGDFPPVLDVEYKKWMPKDKIITKEIMDWIKIIEEHYGVKPIIYCPDEYYERYLKKTIKDEYPMWFTDFKAEPRYKWVFWQQTDQLELKGFKGKLDKNVFFGTKNQLNQLTID